MPEHVDEFIPWQLLTTQVAGTGFSPCSNLKQFDDHFRILHTPVAVFFFFPGWWSRIFFLISKTTKSFLSGPVKSLYSPVRERKAYLGVFLSDWPTFLMADRKPTKLNTYIKHISAKAHIFRFLAAWLQVWLEYFAKV